jgi:hypothetical protein
VERFRIAVTPTVNRRTISRITAHSGIVGTGVGPGLGAGVGVGVGVGGGSAAQLATLTELVSSVTAPFCANARPFMPAPVVSVMLATAMMFPTNDVPVPSVAELPTCQNTLHRFPPLTDAALAVSPRQMPGHGR